MRKSFIVLLLITFCIITASKAQNGQFGLGIVVGEPTGISGKYWTGQTTAIDGAVAWSFNHDGSFYIHADFLIHNFNIIEVEEGKMPLYYGFGGKVVLADKSILGAHVPLGIAYMFETAPLDIFLEIRPGINLLPDTRFDMSGGIGVRYYFD